MKLYPIMLKVADRRVVVVGGGPVALRRARTLSDAGARVLMVAERARQGADLRDMEVLRERYEAKHLAGAAMVFACTDDYALNARIAEDARAAGATVNCADQPEDCDFFVPATVVDGDVVVAIGTGGSSPGLAGRLRKRLADALPERIGEFAAALGRLREKVRAEVPELQRRGEIMTELSSETSYEQFCKDGEDALTQRLEELLG